LNINYISNTGFTGPNAVGTTGATYFLDSVNLQINVPNTTNKYLINASCQILSDNNGVANISASILRSNTGMSGTTLPSSYINLANNIKNDVIYPPVHTGQSSLNDLNTSLWSLSTNNPNAASVNGATINMQSYDTGFTGPGNYYYAIRVNTDKPYLYYGNIRMSTINFN